MRKDLRPFWVKKLYLRYRKWYTHHFIEPRCDYLGSYPTFMKPWHVHLSGPNIEIGDSATVIGEPHSPVNISVWGRELGQGSIKIGNAVLLSPGTRISASDEIVIGDSVMTANGVYITDSDWHGIYDRIERDEKATPVSIGNNVWLCDNATVLKGVTIGENSIIAASAVVTRDIPANVVAAGNPAKIVKQLDPQARYVTRAEFFSEPLQKQQFFEEVERTILAENGTLNWLRALFFPARKD
jgi:acetyltransferase-like isoleucine patch superfamily enzyme